MKNNSIEKKAIFIIPAYNEEENIEHVFSNIDSKMRELGIGFHIILVNDGSTDSTKANALKFQDKLSMEIIDHEVNKGVGTVFRSGFKRALEIARGTDIIVTKEADNTSNLDILPDMLNKIESGDDLVLASCYASGGRIIGTTVDRLFLSSIANSILRVIFSIKGVNTYSSFYRVYRAQMLKRASFAYKDRLIEDDGFTCMVELLIKLNRLPIRITEVPMILRCNFRKGSSKMKKMKTIISYFGLIRKEISYSKSQVHQILKKYESFI